MHWLLGLTFVVLALGQLFANFFVSRIEVSKMISYKRSMRVRVLLVFLPLLFFTLLYIVFGEFGFNFLEEVKRIRVSKGLGYFAKIDSRLTMLKYIDVCFGVYLGFFLFDLISDILRDKQISFYTILSAVSIILLDTCFGGRTQLFNVSLLIVFFLATKKLVFTSRIFVLLVSSAAIAILISNSTRSTHSYKRNVAIQQVVDYNAATLVALSERDRDQLNQKTSEITFGRLSFYGIEQWLRRFGALKSIEVPALFDDWSTSVRILKKDNYQRELNTYSWLIYILNDFGYLGSLFVVFFMGFVFSLSGILAHKWIVLHSVHLTGVLMFLRSNNEMILATDYYWTAAVVCAILLWKKRV